MTAQRRPAKPVTVTVTETTRSGVLYGPVRVIHPAIRRTGCPWQYDPLRHVYRVPKRHLDRVMAAIENAGHRVDYQQMLPGWPHS